MKQTKQHRIFSKLLAAPALAAMALAGMTLLASPAQANNCAAVCDYTVSCFEMNAKAYLNANPNDASAQKKWKKFQRQQKKARRSCIKSCSKFEAAAVACYQKSGGAVNGPSCVAATNCLRPYIK
ncbi:MAG: hypothetical protein NXI24_11465 [bacterium]|nr:hypothetical protein [bacterium]